LFPVSIILTMAYGIQIRNALGNITLDTTTRSANLIVSGTVSVTTSATKTGNYYEGLSTAISFPGITQANTNIFEIMLIPKFVYLGTTGSSIAEHVVILRPSDIGAGNPANSTFKFRFYGVVASVTKSFTYWGFRY